MPNSNMFDLYSCLLLEGIIFFIKCLCCFVCKCKLVFQGRYMEVRAQIKGISSHFLSWRIWDTNSDVRLYICLPRRHLTTMVLKVFHLISEYEQIEIMFVTKRQYSFLTKSQIFTKFHAILNKVWFCLWWWWQY